MLKIRWNKANLHCSILKKDKLIKHTHSFLGSIKFIVWSKTFQARGFWFSRFPLPGTENFVHFKFVEILLTHFELSYSVNFSNWQMKSRMFSPAKACKNSVPNLSDSNKIRWMRNEKGKWRASRTEKSHSVERKR